MTTTIKCVSKKLLSTAILKTHKYFALHCQRAAVGSALLGIGKPLIAATHFQIYKEAEFRSALQLILKKATQPYWLIAKISIYGLFFFFCAFSSMYNFSAGKTVTYNGSAFSFFIGLIIAVLLTLFFAALDYYVFGNLFPPVIFAWGEEAKRSDKNHARRNNIFWGIIVAIVVGILSSYLTGKFFT